MTATPKLGSFRLFSHRQSLVFIELTSDQYSAFFGPYTRGGWAFWVRIPTLEFCCTAPSSTSSFSLLSGINILFGMHSFPEEQASLSLVILSLHHTRHVTVLNTSLISLLNSLRWRTGISPTTCTMVGAIKNVSVVLPSLIDD